MKIFLYNPDDLVSYNFIPHLWMFLLKSLTPDGVEVIIADRKIQRMSEKEIASYVSENKVDLVGIGAMTRMISKAYRVSDEIRKRGIPVIIGGPHASVMPHEALKHCDSVAIGESDEFWGEIVEDAFSKKLKKIYRNKRDENGVEKRPSLKNYPDIRWDKIDLKGFNSVPEILIPFVRKFAKGWENFYLIPVETQRGCPYGCEFCTVTRFFGGKIRYRDDDSVIRELKIIKKIEERGDAHVGVIFVDDNFAINRLRTKNLLRKMIDEKIGLNYFAQISVNLLKDDELVDLLSESGCKMVFIGLESISEKNLKLVKKNQNKPEEYRKIIEKLFDRDIFVIASFIFGFDGDFKGIAEKTFESIREWPPILPVFGQLTPYPGTPLFEKLIEEGRMIRKDHWMNVLPFEMAHAPISMSSEDVFEELRKVWSLCYSPEMNMEAVEESFSKSTGFQIFLLITRLMFRGIYFPQRSKLKWIKVLYRNRKSIFKVYRRIKNRKNVA